MNKRDFLKGSAALAATMAMRSTAANSPAVASVPRTNWAENFHYSTNHVLQPTTVAETQDAVRSASHLRALGTRHSFNSIADSTDTQISTLKLNDVQLNPSAKTVRVGGGIRYGDLALQMDKAGWALHNLASLPHISVAGAIATATHGSGPRNGNLSTAVTEIEFVSADGAVHTLSRAKDGDKFSGAVASLGALGVVTHVTLEMQPRYDMTQIVYENLSFSQLERNFAAIMGTGYSTSLFTNWQNGGAGEVWIKRRVDQGGSTPPPPMFYGATLAKEKLHPVGHGTNAEACTDQFNTVGPWYERLPHFKMNFTPSSGHEIQTEFFVPFDRGYEAVRAIETLRDKITPHLFITELRAVAQDDLWMSMAYKRPSLAIHFTWKPEHDAVMELIPQVQAKLQPFQPRPHWAKVFTLDAKTVAAAYPRVNDFKSLMREYDPQGKFLNEYMHKALLG